VIVKLEDLVKWAHSDFSKWRCGLRATPVKTEAFGRNGQKEALLRYRQSTLNSGLNFKDVLKEKADLGKHGSCFYIHCVGMCSELHPLCPLSWNPLLSIYLHEMK
jgi:hypothetical protein